MVVVRNKAPGTKIRDFLGEGCDSSCALELGRSAPQPLPVGGVWRKGLSSSLCKEGLMVCDFCFCVPRPTYRSCLCVCVNKKPKPEWWMLPRGAEGGKVRARPKLIGKG